MKSEEREAKWILAAAKTRIASELLDREEAPMTVGEITLYPHQRRAVARLRTLLALAGGALLADATGLGKTYVALALATGLSQILIIAPAALADRWRDAAARARVRAIFVSMERLSRGTLPDFNAWPDLVIIDEAHHFRNPHTRRYAAAAMLCDRARVLLLSATPLQNRRDDLVAQLALFLGDRARVASDAAISRLIVRRRSADPELRLPTVQPARRVHIGASDDLLDELLALPPPVPGADEGEGGALVTYTLLRQWTSSRAALVAALRRRLAKAVALATSLEAGRWPSREELHAWSYGGDAVQLAMPELLAPLGADTGLERQSLLEAVRAHSEGLRTLLARLRVTEDPDPRRAAALDEICRAHPGARVIAFSQYTETVDAVARLLMSRRAGVAALTARGGRVAGGRITRREVLAQFAPGREADARVAERISLLVASDVLSEGLDLQRASVVVHLDLPWNPARLEQRVGRVRRLGARHDAVFVYVLSPPASSERVLRVETRLREKLGLAARIVGLDSPSLVEAAVDLSAAPPELESDLLTALERWRGEPRGAARDVAPLVAGVLAHNEGLLALVAIGDERLLVGSLGDGGLRLDTSVLSALIGACDGAPSRPSEAECTRAMRMVQLWAEGWLARHRLHTPSAEGARSRARIAARIATLVSALPRHEVASLAAVASHARRSLGTPLGAAAERALTELANDPSADDGWLRRVAALGDERKLPELSPGEPKPIVIIVLRCAAASEARSPEA